VIRRTIAGGVAAAILFVAACLAAGAAPEPGGDHSQVGAAASAQVQSSGLRARPARSFKVLPTVAPALPLATATTFLLHRLPARPLTDHTLPAPCSRGPPRP
jgi:hypothetical protein